MCFVHASSPHPTIQYTQCKEVNTLRHIYYVVMTLLVFHFGGDNLTSNTNHRDGRRKNKKKEKKTKKKKKIRRQKIETYSSTLHDKALH